MFTLIANRLRLAARVATVAAAAVVFGGCVSTSGPATYRWDLDGKLTGHIDVKPSDLTCDLYYDRGGYGTDPAIPTFLMTTRFFGAVEGENQAAVSFGLILAGAKGPGAYPLSARGLDLSFTFTAYSQGDAVPFNSWSISDGTITITSAQNAYKRGAPSVVVGRFDVTFSTVAVEQIETFRLTGPWECTVPASKNGAVNAHK